MLMAFASISTDLYLPALPPVVAALRAGHGAVELTISGHLIVSSLGRLLWGPIGDRYRRRLPIAAGLVLFVIGSTGWSRSGFPVASNAAQLSPRGKLPAYPARPVSDDSHSNGN
jgi:DHA1 family bicyclomycin/chloramphenicol resistance-like MFS transporter